MKTSFCLPIAFWFCLSASLLHAQSTANSGNAPSLPPSTPYSIVQQDANSQVWQRTVYELGPSGQAVPREHRYTELATGLNHLVNGQWVASEEEIDISPDGNSAAATNGQHQVYFPGDIVQGVIELDTPDGLKLQSRPIALSYDDGSNTVLIAVLTNSPGYLFSANQVIYPNAFTGVQADLLYTYTKAGFEQDIILRVQPPTPESFGLNPQTARLQVLTEFFNPPQPTITATTLPEQAGVSLTDENLNFGVMEMIRGRAFLLGADAHDGGVFVSKSWVTLEGQQFLVEEVPVKALADELAQLPVSQTASAKPNANSALHVVSARRLLPAPRPTKTNPRGRFMQVAKTATPARGLVLDYQTISGTSTNYTFSGDTTYYISGGLTLFNTNTFEGGAVIKSATNSSLSITPGPPGTSPGINWEANAYCPVIFTATDDNSVGETIANSTGTPTNYYARIALCVLGASATISNCRIDYAHEAIFVEGGLNFYNGQIVNCQSGLACGGGSVYLGNALFANTMTNFNFQASGVTVTAQNTTFSGSLVLVSAGGGSLALTNCIFANVTNLFYGGVSLNGNYNGFYNSYRWGPTTFTNTSYPFQQVGGGNYYLTNGCNFFNQGTTNINSTLLAALQTKTTYPPIVYSNATISIPTTFSPQVQRDTDTPDLGYHYDPLDWVFAETEVDSNVTFTAGTAAGWFRTTSGWYDAGDGIHLMNGATANLTGTATAPVWWVRLNAVQEQDLSGGYGPGGLTSWGSGPPSYVATINAQFAHCSMMNNDANHFRDDGEDGGGHLVVNATNCEFYSTGVEGYYMTLNFTNCLFFRGGAGAQSDHNDAGLTLQNCTFYGSDWYDVVVQHWSGATWPVYIVSCAFENCDFEDVDTNYSYYDYNAFIQGQNRLPISGAHDVIVTNSFNWQTSWLGGFYEPTNSPLLHKGNTNANLLGLYHFTTQTNQTVEGTNIVSIGYHYVAVTNGIPLDSNGDGIPDYLEDANGNGLVDSGEIGWNIPGDLGLQVIITQPRNNSIIP
jgi:hypothetical protein